MRHIIQYFQQTKNVMVLLLWRASLSQAQVRRKEGSSSENQESLKSFKVFLLPLAPKDIRRPKREQSTATSWSESIDI